MEAQSAGTAATAGELAQRANLTTGAITGVITRLESAGYARRHSDPADRRRVRVVADETAAARLFEVYGPNYQRFADLFADYDPDEIAVLPTGSAAPPRSCVHRWTSCAAAVRTTAGSGQGAVACALRRPEASSGGGRGCVRACEDE
ncbi:MarR family winged helix-turn-helix transcriptional regulator [Streptomyces cyaneofuscatus]|uniref:MarR family winged helix-turn-helix transcriptional regulator n=1 Tax=Streptomyces cyaneofuscatus TaxID=66883 RepID=UPI003793A15D